MWLTNQYHGVEFESKCLHFLQPMRGEATRTRPRSSAPPGLSHASEARLYTWRNHLRIVLSIKRSPGNRNIRIFPQAAMALQETGMCRPQGTGDHLKPVLTWNIMRWISGLFTGRLEASGT